MKAWFKQFLAAFAALVVFSGLVLLFLSSLTRERFPKVPEGAVLVLDLSIPIVDKPGTVGPSEMLDAALRGGSTKRCDLYTLLEAIRRAGEDQRIKGIYLHGEVAAPGLSSGWAAVEEVREALKAFKATGKKVYAYHRVVSEKTYYLTSQADTVVIHPTGVLEFNGLVSERLFFARALEQYGVEVQVTRVGKYKSAVEPYLLEKMSPENREQIENLLGDLFDPLLEGVAAARELSMEALLDLVNRRGMLVGEEAVEAGLVDRTAYFDEVLGDLQALTGAQGSGAPPRITLADYARALEGSPGKMKQDRIAVIYAEGEIVDGRNRQKAGGDTVAQLLRKAREDENVKAVVLRINSPGGSASASEVILREVRLIRDKKPIVVSMGSLAASGGYYIATFAHEILVEPTTITGSIGAFGLLPSGKELLQELGITTDAVKTSPLADMLTYYRPRTEAEMEIFQHLVDRTYEDFLGRVVESRGLDRRTVEEIAQGRVWSGRDALELGLADSMGGLEDAMEKAAERAGLDREWSPIFYQVKRSLAEDFVEALTRGEEPEDDLVLLSGSGSMRGPLLDAVRRLLRVPEILHGLNDPQGVYMRLPYDLTIR